MTEVFANASNADWDVMDCTTADPIAVGGGGFSGTTTTPVANVAIEPAPLVFSGTLGTAGTSSASVSLPANYAFATAGQEPNAWGILMNNHNGVVYVVCAP